MAIVLPHAVDSWRLLVNMYFDMMFILFVFTICNFLSTSQPATWKKTTIAPSCMLHVDMLTGLSVLSMIGNGCLIRTTIEKSANL